MRPVSSYLVAAALSVGSILTLSLISRFVPMPLTLLVLPILVSAYIGRRGPGLLATGLVVLAAASDLIPHGSPFESSALLVIGIGVSFTVEVLHRWRSREREGRRAIEQSEQRFTQVFHASPVALSLSRFDDRRIVEVNAAYLSTFGVSREAIVGKTPLEAHVDTPDHLREHMFQQLEAGRDVHEQEIPVTTPTGTRFLTLWSRTLELGGVRYAFSTFLDVTDHKRAVEEARRSDERFRELAENIQEVFWLTDPENHTMLYISPAYEKIFGRSCAALYADARDWLTPMHPDDRERMAAFNTTSIVGPQEENYRIIRDGKVRSIHIAVFPVRDSNGKVIRIAGVAEDITDKLQLEAQLRETQKLESLGMLAGGVAHDFNNVLAVIGANAGLLAEVIPPDHPDRELVDDIEAAVGRACSLTRQLLAFSRKQVIEPIVLDLNAAISDTRKMLRRMMGEDIVITTSFEPELGCARIDPGYFVQVLMNLAVNARDAMPRGGTLSLITRNLEHEVIIEVTDTGTGMPPEVRERVFEPFFTTKGIGKGTGLGLSVVHGIVQQAGGRIEIDSVVGAGTTIRIVFPRVNAPPEKITDVAVAGAQGSEKIVLVDDDMFVRRSTSRALRSRGYTVLEAADGQAALRLLRDHGRDVALLVTDVVMPGIDGRELVEAARQRRPSLKVLYMSGYTDDAVLRHGLDKDVQLVEKPFRGHTLAGKVRHVLDAR